MGVAWWRAIVLEGARLWIFLWLVWRRLYEVWSCSFLSIHIIAAPHPPPTATSTCYRANRRVLTFRSFDLSNVLFDSHQHGWRPDACVLECHWSAGERRCVVSAGEHAASDSCQRGRPQCCNRPARHALRCRGRRC